MDASALNRFVDYLHLLAYFLLGVKLVWSRLSQTYFWFTSYVFAQSLLGVVLRFVRTQNKNLYGTFFFCSEAVFAALSILAILEIFNLVMRNHPGIGGFGRKMLIFALAIAVTLSALTIFLDGTLNQPADGHNQGSVQSGSQRQNPVLRSFLVYFRFIMGGVMLFWLFLLAFIAWFPVALSRNTVIHSAIFAVYFMAKTGILLALNLLGHQIVSAVNSLIPLVALLCLCCWLLFLNPAGEKKMVRVGHRWNPADEDRLLQQLDAINATLARSSKQ
jgi:hypothetical protein